MDIHINNEHLEKGIDKILGYGRKHSLNSVF